jgi:hypothetical protein
MHDDRTTSDQVAPGVGSRHASPQPSLFPLRALREFLRTDYRGLEASLRDGADRRDALGLAKVPDHFTLQKAAGRLLEKGEPVPCCTGRSPARGPAV